MHLISKILLRGLKMPRQTSKDMLGSRVVIDGNLTQ